MGLYGIVRHQIAQTCSVLVVKSHCMPSLDASCMSCEQGCGGGILLRHVACAAFSGLYRACVMLLLQHMYRKANVLWQASMFLLCKAFRLSLCCDGFACK